MRKPHFELTWIYTTHNNMNFLIGQIDNIGDTILSIPMSEQIKKAYSNAKIIYLSRHYVKDIVLACPFIDTFLDFNQLNTMPQKNAVQFIKNLNCDVFINSAARRETAQLAKLAAIKRRIGTNRRWFHWLYCNERINFSKSHSNLHEVQANLKLLQPLNILINDSIKLLYPKLSSKIQLSESLSQWQDNHRFNLIIHPGSNFQGREWPVEHYVTLISQLPTDKFKIFITGSLQEATRFLHTIIKKLDQPAINLMGKLSLADFITFTQQADGFLGSGTGPLHMAAALGIHTLGLFPNAPTIGPERWAPLGPKAQYLQATQSCTNACNNPTCACMKTITPESVLQHLQQMKIKKHYGNNNRNTN